MQTNQIEAILDTAYHAAAIVAADQVRRHLRPFNLKRHPLEYSDNLCMGADTDCLTLGGLAYWSFHMDRPVHQAIREAGEFVDRLPEGVKAVLKDHL